ncbi:MAG: type II toxin-antitoxin system HicA family toxin [Dethiobacter sp.]|nr:type II toxin-antitoxin system HicA family toxin [Dethiobacter sp.]
MRSEDSKEIIKRLEREGWYLVRIKGSHHQFKHYEKLGTVTVQHPKKSIYGHTLRSIYRQASWEW